jgi:hypothetical protein
MDADTLRRWLDQRAENHEFSGVALVWRDRAGSAWPTHEPDPSEVDRSR